MRTEYINGDIYLRMIRLACSELEKNRETINGLNVFPVPDGDTGDNMLMTVEGGRDADSSSSMFHDISKGMLYGARGNSGVILSRFFFGLNSVLAEANEKIPVSAFVDGLGKGVKESYSAVGQPKEGTILTVMRESFEAVSKAEIVSYEELFDILIREAKESLKKTPEKLDILKNAGVVDSGGAGLICIFSGMREGLCESTETAASEKKTPVIRMIEKSEKRLGYCTEFILQPENEKDFSLDCFRNFLFSVGESVVAFECDRTVKVHVHTFSPDKILREALNYGELLTVKIENMTLQHTESIRENELTDFAVSKKTAVVAVASGEGIKKLLIEAGCDVIIEGGQSMNPSAGDIVDAVRTAAADTVYVFANNANVILSARQAAEMCSFCNMVVVPTKDVGQCYLALSERDGDLAPDDQLNAFMTAAGEAFTCFISTASRNCIENGVPVTEGYCIAFGNGIVFSCVPTRRGAAEDLLAKTKDHDVALILYGADVPQEEAVSVAKKFSVDNPMTEYIAVSGGQAVYDYVIIFS